MTHLPRKAYFLFLAAVFLVGMGRVAILPPFEGADETAHYSRVLSTAFPPAKAKDALRIDGGVYGYYLNGPMSAGWVRNPYMHTEDRRLKGKKDATGLYPDYHVFFAKPALWEKYERLYRRGPAQRKFTPSPESDWQLQHPPLYYLLAGWVCRHLPDATLAGRLLALRAFGFVLAFAGFAVGAEASARHLAWAGYKNAAAAAAFGAFMPFLMPAFFNDVTHIGNETLTLFLSGCVWALLLQHLRNPDDRMGWLLLGFTLGLSLLTKATMFPPACGIVLFLAGHHAFRKKDWRALLPAAAVAATVLLVTAAWYERYLAFHAFRSGGMIVFSEGLGHLSASLPWGRLLFDVTETLFSAVAHFSDWYSISFGAAAKIAILLPVLWALAAYAAAAVKKGLFSVELLPLWTVAPLLGALSLHSVFSALAFGPETAPTAGYYAHILAPAFALALGLGFAELLRGRGVWGGKDIVAVLGLMAVADTADILWREATMYGGCWWEVKGEQSLHQAACEHDFGLLFRHLEMLAWPGLAVPCFAAGFLCVAAGFALILPGKTGASART